MMCNRIFTITCRGGKAVLFSNKPDSKGRRHYQKFTASSTNNASIKALIKVLQIIPDDCQEQVAILAPEGVSCLSFDDTRAFWIENECTKTGEVLSEETFCLVAELDELLETKRDKVQIFGHRYVKSYKYKCEIKRAWDYTDKILPVQYVASTSSSDFDF